MQSVLGLHRRCMLETNIAVYHMFDKQFRTILFEQTDICFDSKKLQLAT